MVLQSDTIFPCLMLFPFHSRLPTKIVSKTRNFIAFNLLLWGILPISPLSNLTSNISWNDHIIYTCSRQLPTLKFNPRNPFQTTLPLCSHPETQHLHSACGLILSVILLWKYSSCIYPVWKIPSNIIECNCIPYIHSRHIYILKYNPNLFWPTPIPFRGYPATE